MYKKASDLGPQVTPTANMPRVHINSVEIAPLPSSAGVSSRDQAKKLLPSAEAFSHRNSQFVAFPHPADETLNPLMAAATLAFSAHRPLVLSPDVVYNVILQGVSAHIATDPERYRKDLVNHEGKEKLTVRDDTLVRGNWDNGWGPSVEGLSAQILARVPLTSSGAVSGLLGAVFSTTNAPERVAHRAVLMDAVKHYYEYEVMTLCGIPWVDIEGTKADWTGLMNILNAGLPLLDLTDWNRELQAILTHFVAAYENPDAADKSFWDGMYYYNGPRGSGGVARVSGWLSKLFLHLQHGRNPSLQKEKVEGKAEPAVAKSETATSDALHSTSATPWTDEAFWSKVHTQTSMGSDALLGTDAFPPVASTPEPKPHQLGVPLSEFSVGLTDTPFVWDHFGTPIAMTLRAGLVGVTASAEHALRVEVGWVVGLRA